MCLISVKELIKELVFFTISHTDENKDYLILSYLMSSGPLSSTCWCKYDKPVATSIMSDVTN